jgi:MoxR-like ATPase
MKQIVDVHYPTLEESLLSNSLSIFYGVRDVKALKKKPSTSELIDWIKLLLVGKVSGDLLEDFKTNTEVPPFIGALLKNEQDTGLYEALRNKTKRSY